MSDSSCTQPNLPRSLRILYAEDELPVQKLIALYLRNAGHRLTVVSNGAEGLNKVQESDFDLVITDRSMPLMDGLQLADALLRLKPEIPVILLTGTPPSEDQKGVHPANIQLILLKPIGPGELQKGLTRLFPPA